jgi:hypothetical protein
VTRFGRGQVVRVLLAAAVVVVLAGTHWLAYRAGERAERERFRGMVTDLQATTPPELLRVSIDTMRAAAKHPDSFTDKDLLFLKTFVKNYLFDVENISIPYAQKAGNLEQEQRYRALAATARDLLAKLPDR